jgi:hypothetical protein
VARVDPSTIQHTEKADGEPPSTRVKLAVIHSTLEATGVEFIDESGSGAEKRLRRNSP